MRTALVALIGLVAGFFFGEALAAMSGMIGFSMFDGAPFGPLLWTLRSLPFVCALAGAVAAVAANNKRRTG